MDEDLCLERAQAGDAEAFGDIVECYSSRLHGYVARYVFDAQDVLDIVQDSFIDAYKGLADFDRERPFLPWLQVVCKHRMLKFLRHRRRERSQSQCVVDDALLLAVEHEEVTDPIQQQRQLQALRACLELMQSPQRELIVGRHLHGHSIAELAARLKVTLDGMAMRLSRLRGTLRRCIESRLLVGERP